MIQTLKERFRLERFVRGMTKSKLEIIGVKKPQNQFIDLFLSKIWAAELQNEAQNSRTTESCYFPAKSV